MLPKGHTQPWCCNTYGCLLSLDHDPSSFTRVAVFRVERRIRCQHASSRHVVHLKPDAIRIFKQHRVIAGCPGALCRRVNDCGTELAQQRGTTINILARPGAQAEVMQADALLHEAFPLVCRVARLDADCRPGADEVRELRAVEYRLHAEGGQQACVEGPSPREVAHGQHDVCHAIDVDFHVSTPLLAYDS